MGTGKANGHGEKLSPITASAAALDAELRRYAELAGAAVRVPLTSEKNLDRATRAVADAAESGRRVLEQVQALVQAISAAREAQQASADALDAQARAVAERKSELEMLVVRYSKLGEVAHTLNLTMQRIAELDVKSRSPQEAAEMGEAFAAMETGMTTVAKHAQELAAEATAKSFEDLGRQAESLRQQVLAAKNRLSLLQKTIPGASQPS